MTVVRRVEAVALATMTRLPRWGNLRLRTKLTLLIGGVMLVLGVATGLLATVRARATLETELTKRGLAIAGDLALFSVKPLLANDLATLRRFVNHSMTQDYVRYVAVLDPEGTVVMHSDLDELGKRLEDPLTRAALASDGPIHGTSPRARDDDPLYDVFCPITAAGARLGTVALGYSRAAVRAEIARARRDIVWIWLLVAALGGMLVFLLSSYISSPITRIAAAMENAPEGEVRAVLGVERGDEIGLLATSFNKMAEDLSRHRKHLNELVEARTAALRDANVRLESEVAERRKVEDALRRSRQELRDLASHLESIREQERTDIAREIHDELGQALTALKMDVHWVGQRVGDAPAVRERQGRCHVEDGRCHRPDRAAHLVAAEAEAPGRPRPVRGHRVAGPGVRAALRRHLRYPLRARRHRPGPGALDGALPHLPGDVDQRGAPRGGLAGGRRAAELRRGRWR